jgi:hypothetical protein
VIRLHVPCEGPRTCSRPLVGPFTGQHITPAEQHAFGSKHGHGTTFTAGLFWTLQSAGENPALTPCLTQVGPDI